VNSRLLLLADFLIGQIAQFRQDYPLIPPFPRSGIPRQAVKQFGKLKGGFCPAAANAEGPSQTNTIIFLFGALSQFYTNPDP
jgi:hypothetical protein